MSKSVGIRARQRKKQGTNKIGIWIIGISAAVVLLVVVAVAFNNRPATIAVTPPDVPGEWVNGKVLGDPDAPVTIQMWEDFLCPACGQWTAEVEPLLIEEYVKTGMAKLDFRHFPLQIHAPGAEMAAMAAECANDQGAFWPYHDRLFQAQADGQAGYSLERLTEYADELSLDSRQLLECMSSQEHRVLVTDSVNQAVAMGLNSTPSVLINGELMANPFDFDALSAEIDRLVAASEGG